MYGENMGEAAVIQEICEDIKFIRENMVSKKEFNTAIETIEVLHHPETMARIEKSEVDIKAGRTKRVRSVKDLLADL